MPSGLNGSQYDILGKPPSALEFARLVQISRPVLIKGHKVQAQEVWSNDYLIERMGDQKISVAITPDGRADAITAGPGGKEYFTEPYVQQMTMAEFLDKLTSDDQNEVLYMQTQNGNLYPAGYFEPGSVDGSSECESLREDAPSEIPWCSEALGRSPEAVNVWIGDSRSTTSIHSDPFENIYTVVRGTKHFTLLPPTEAWCLKERSYPHATYTRDSPTSPLKLAPTDYPPVSWSSIKDPDDPSTLSSNAHPIHITLQAGDTLYLPVGWWHYVRQSGDITIALNWWYDLQMRGAQWVWLSFLRGMGRDAMMGNPPHVQGTEGAGDVYGSSSQ
ncbi:Clavaminate synthase-like protein [Gloeophyllum trabeum ATCC 11539]|uniref:Clavaminate synthase-like protein n=1 Tax=Gloeophyllum trabeum (strain ATCC 11539 / FP-39264 / Madison 617) TaxID=670483 RepID=S7QIS3_GLOTA|nr:Clavaminate synthase-like protein [Gloeophyllum trabeum ATCC 11539]EPQ59252.1 Clavaminate synthase-like protein [Gloeophyllum trabeum ATCC 11539]